MDSIKLIGKLEDACIERYLDEINFKLDDNTSMIYIYAML